MNDRTNYQNNPLHGVSLNKLITLLSEQYGFEILYAYLNINCFKTNPSIESSEKFLKKTDWAREKVEGFYLYEYKSLPRASAKEFELPPRDRTIPLDQECGEPNELSLEDAEQLREKRAKKAAEFGNGTGYRNGKRFSNERGGEKDRSKTTPYRTKKPAARGQSNSSSNSPYGGGSSNNSSSQDGEQKTGKPFGGNSYSNSFDKKDASKEGESQKPSSGSSDPWAKHK
jgi:uncharacterized protein (DUF2132 family)